MEILDNVLACYGFNNDDHTTESFGSGLINNTCLVTRGDEKYILQRVNDNVFKNPFLIAENIDRIAAYLKRFAPDYYFTTPLKTQDGRSLIKMAEGYYRIFPFVKNSHSIDVVEDPLQAFEAAKQFGLFTKSLSGIDITTINITLPSFHDLALRYDQFLEALQLGNAQRIVQIGTLIDELILHADIVGEYLKIIKNPAFKLRVTHHDTKISNILFDTKGKGACVIDLDTVMPGYFISDVGDMMRTYLSPVSEEESDFSKIAVREDYYAAIVEGYNVYMSSELTKDEQQRFFYAGKYMIYMQALRFITDYINDDIYYGAKYPEHNRVRGENQITLLRRLMEKETALRSLEKK